MRRFKNRREAGKELAELLTAKGLDRPLVLGIPRGGVPVAIEVARALNCEAGVIVARKLRAPYSPELAIGAVTATGTAWINEELTADMRVDAAYIERETALQRAEARRREEAFDGSRTAAPAGRVVVVADDGIATGATMFAAIQAMRDAGASRVIAAVPLGPRETLDMLRSAADDVVCVSEPEDFFAVGLHYDDFSPVEDEAVIEALDSYRGPFQAVDLRVERHGASLAARLRYPRRRAPVVIFVHGLGSSKDSPRNTVVADALLESGLAVLLFDLSGHGDSTGPPNPDLDDFVADIEAICGSVSGMKEVRGDRIALAGSSLGGTAALRAVTAGRAHPDALVLRAPPIGPEDVVALAVPTLLLTGDRDPLSAASVLVARASPLVDLRVVHGAGHLFEEPGTLAEAVEATVSWLRIRLAGAVSPGAGR